MAQTDADRAKLARTFPCPPAARAGDAGDKRKSEGERSKAQDFDLIGFVAPRAAMQSFHSAAFGGTNLKLSNLPG
jgi:hypothetical protein